MQALRAPSGTSSGVIARELHLKRTPTLEFVYDHSIDEGMHDTGDAAVGGWRG